jgi:hypothetical protein
METVTIRITDTNGRDKGAMPVGIERRADGMVWVVHHAGEQYVAAARWARTRGPASRSPSIGRGAMRCASGLRTI